MLNIKRLILALTAIISITTAWAQQGAQILSDELTYNFRDNSRGRWIRQSYFHDKEYGRRPFGHHPCYRVMRLYTAGMDQVADRSR